MLIFLWNRRIALLITHEFSSLYFKLFGIKSLIHDIFAYTYIKFTNIYIKEKGFLSMFLKILAALTYTSKKGIIAIGAIILVNFNISMINRCGGS